MRLPLVLLALAASMQPSHGLLHSRRSLATTYPACTAAQSKTFLDNLGAVSSGCANATSYAWDGDADPTSAQRTELCKCTVSALSVPKCHWTKLGQYDVSVSEHFNFAYNCSSISGKAVPKLTEVDAASYTPAPATTTAAPAETTEAAEAPASTTEAPVSTTAAPSSQASTTGSDCTVSQLNAFTGALNTASSGCMGASSYNWGGSTDPTEAQYKEICKCAAVTAFTIPNCYIQKAQYRLLLSEHYNWVTGVQCPTFSPSTAVADTKSSSSSNVGLIAGIAGGIVAVVLVVVIGLFLYKRHRNEKEDEELQHYHQPHHDMNAMNAARQQVTYPQDFQQPYQQKRTRPPVENINTI